MFIKDGFFKTVQYLFVKKNIFLSTFKFEIKTRTSLMLPVTLPLPSNFYVTINFLCFEEAYISQKNQNRLLIFFTDREKLKVCNLSRFLALNPLK